MDPVFSREEKKLYQAKTPKDYIDKSYKLDIPSGRKAYVTKFWLKKTGNKVSSLEYYRNRHPYWKQRKGEGSAERVRERMDEHDYGTGSRLDWDDDLIREFLEANSKDKQGKYINRDWELARDFECTIATIQHFRRKYNMVLKIIKKKYSNVTKKRLIEYLKYGEGNLRDMVRKMKLK